MKKLFVAILVSVLTIHAAAAADTVVQVAGRSYTNATITSDGVFVKVISGTGIERFPISRMTTNEQARWHYNSATAAIQAEKAAEADAVLREQMAAQSATTASNNIQQAATETAATPAASGTPRPQNNSTGNNALDRARHKAQHATYGE